MLIRFALRILEMGFSVPQNFPLFDFSFQRLTPRETMR